jgi:hypothetical protein
MTAVGKILVFVNLLFSLVVGGLVTMVYVARTHWTDEYAKLDKRYQIAQASEGALGKEFAGQVDSARASEEAMRKQLKKALADLDAVAEANGELKRSLEEQKVKETKGEAARAAAQLEIARRQADVEQIRTHLKDARKEVVQLTLDKEAFRDKAVQATIDLKSVQDKNQQLVAQLEQNAKELVRLRTSGGARTTTVAGSGPNPPQENIDGLIETTDPSSRLVTVTLGSDAGLTKGHTLEVYRPNTIVPSHSKYLGRIRIVEVQATRAVGQWEGRMTVPPQRGDHVASQIMVGGS